MSQITARFQNIYNLERHRFEIIGCGAIGSFTTMNLARAGADKFMLWDPDTVDAVNIGVQHYALEHIGASKVKMLRKQIYSVNPHAKVTMRRQKYQSFPFRHPFYGYYSRGLSRYYKFDKKCFVIIGIDNMSGRKQISNLLWNNDNCHYYRYDTWIIDARMGSETFMYSNWRLYTDEEIQQLNELLNRNTTSRNDVYNIQNRAKQRFLNAYEQEWYSDEDGNPEPCNARSTNYCASMAGAFINNAIRKICDLKSPTSTKITFNFPSLQLSADTDYSRILNI